MDNTEKHSSFHWVLTLYINILGFKHSNFRVSKSRSRSHSIPAIDSDYQLPASLSHLYRGQSQPFTLGQETQVFFQQLLKMIPVDNFRRRFTQSLATKWASTYQVWTGDYQWTSATELWIWRTVFPTIKKAFRSNRST